MTALLVALEGGVIFVALWMLSAPAPAPDDWVALASSLGMPGLLATSAVAALYYADCYDMRQVPSVGRVAPRLPRGLILAALPLGASYVLLPHAGAAVLATLALMAGLPLVVRSFTYPILRSRRLVERVLVVGAGPLARQVVEAIQAEAGYRYVLAGTIDQEPARPSPRWRRLRAVDGVDRMIATLRPDRIVVAPSPRGARLPVQAFLEARSRGIAVDDAAEFYERLTGKIAIESLTPWSLILCKGFRRSHATLVASRAVSVLIAGLGLLVAAPLCAVVALAIALDSRGPVLFRQERVGLGGRRFTLLKFRTMRADGGAPSEWAGDNDHRITRVGRWLRAFRLDELPQFVNVLRGDMDIVGPRPHPGSNFSLLVTVLRNLPECGEEIPYYSLRLMVRPGVTGWAQVRYQYANNLEEEIEKMRYDLYYVKHRSLWLDLRILAATVKTVVAGRGAVRERERAATATAPVWHLTAGS